MRIVSNHLLYRLTIRGEVVQTAQDERGVLRTNVIVPELTLQFSRNAITAYDIEFGMQTWMSGSRREATDPFGQESWGAHPSDRDGVAGGHAYRGWDPRLQFSIFDTATLNEKDRVEADEYFTANPQSPDFIVVTRASLKPPWPSYDDTQWKKIAPLARELGFVGEAVAYEEAKDEPRPAVLAALREEYKAAVVEAEEDAALKVIVP